MENKPIKFLVVVDMQNDFCTEGGTLANPEEIAVTNKIAEYIRKHGTEYDAIISTLDTHAENYLDTNEGIHLPVKHCVGGTWGHEQNKEIASAIVTVAYSPLAGAPYPNMNTVYVYVTKPTFGSEHVYATIENIRLVNGGKNADVEVDVCGVCTDICVVSNALMLKAKLYNNGEKVSVIEDLCAGTSVDNHNAAIQVMKSCQIEMK